MAGVEVRRAGNADQTADICCRGGWLARNVKSYGLGA